MLVVFTKYSDVQDMPTIQCVCCLFGGLFVEKKQSVTCDFADSYLCGYTTETLGSLAWQRFSGPGPNTQTSPTTSYSGSIAGKLSETNTNGNTRISPPCYGYQCIIWRAIVHVMWSE